MTDAFFWTFNVQMLHIISSKAFSAAVGGNVWFAYQWADCIFVATDTRFVTLPIVRAVRSISVWTVAQVF